MRYDELVQAFKEVEKGFSTQEAVTEATRCLKCEDAPCAKVCPAEINVAQFIRRISSRNFSGSIKVIKEDNILAGICARICPQECLCEGECSSSELAKPIDIGRLQRFAADQELEKGPKRLRSMPPKGIAVAVVGSGPAGLSAATFLKRLGYDVDLFEAESHPGGVLMYGIPAYRLPKQVVYQEVDYIKSLGVNVRLKEGVENPVSLLDRYRAVFVGTGCGRPIALSVAGEEMDGVMQAIDLLREVNSALIIQEDCNIELGEDVVVIGGGNAAIDAAVTARKLGAAMVTILYRRSEEEMPAWEEEREFARKQGVSIRTLASPVRFLGESGRLTQVECLEMKLGEEDESGRKRPLPIEGSEFLVPCQTALLAIGQGAPTGLEDLEKDQWNRAKVDEETMATSVPGVYAGGDLIRGSDMAVQAVGDGKKAAFAMDAWIQENT